MAALYGVDDNRLVLLEGQLCYPRILDWERCANGAVDSWIFAERVICARGSEYSRLVSYSPSFCVEISDREICLDAVTKHYSEEP